VLGNHGCGKPVVWICSASPQTARVQLLARHLSPTSGLQRVLQCEIEKNWQTEIHAGLLQARNAQQHDRRIK